MLDLHSLPVSQLIEQIFSQLPHSRACNLPSELFSIAGEAAPRWIFPPGRNLNLVLKGWTPYKVSSRIRWRAIRAAQHIGVTGLLPAVERINLSQAAGIDWGTLGWTRDTPPVPVIYLGTPGPRRKAVVHLVDPALGRCDAIVKVPLRYGARESILREADVLAVLEDEVYTSSPGLLVADPARAVTSQEFLSGTSGSRRFLPEYQNLLRSLVLLDEHTTLASHASECMSVEDCTEPRLLAALAEQADTSRLPACWVHGDFAPWNIRHRGRLAPALIDWEMAQRSGLPLQDAFHFLHIQDFLFGGRPGSHFPALEFFAKGIGVTALQCRKLEIAYLTQSYLRCFAWGERDRASFLLKSLTAVLHTRLRSTVAIGSYRRLRLVSSRSPRQETMRAEMFAAVTAKLEQERIRYCILSGHDERASALGSDVDIMFRPGDLGRLPVLLSQAGASVGARLVQSIRHETSASYFVLAMAQGKHVCHLAVDAYGDYRRDGRTWLQASDIVTSRRRYMDFYRPSVAGEFIYRLIKAVLKQSVSDDHLKSLQHLFARDAAACRQRIARFWPGETAVQLERAVVEQKYCWFQQYLPNLEEQLLVSKPVPNHFRRLWDRLRDGGRLIGRILRPTGMQVLIQGDVGAQQSEFADRLSCSLASAFRRTRRVSSPQSLGEALRQTLRLRIGRISSTLIIEVLESDRMCSPVASTTLAFSRILRPADLVLHLRPVADQTQSSKAHTRDSSRWMELDADDSVEHLLERANAAVLDWLEKRTAKRFGLRPPTPRLAVRAEQGQPAPAPEFESVGSD